MFSCSYVLFQPLASVAVEHPLTAPSLQQPPLYNGHLFLPGCQSIQKFISFYIYTSLLRPPLDSIQLINNSQMVWTKRKNVKRKMSQNVICTMRHWSLFLFGFCFIDILILYFYARINNIQDKIVVILKKKTVPYFAHIFP